MNNTTATQEKATMSNYTPTKASTRLLDELTTGQHRGDGLPSLVTSMGSRRAFDVGGVRCTFAAMRDLELSGVRLQRMCDHVYRLAYGPQLPGDKALGTMHFEKDMYLRQEEVVIAAETDDCDCVECGCERNA